MALLRNAQSALPALPKFAQPRGPGHKVYSLVPLKKDGSEMLADYVLFEDSMLRSKVPYTNYKVLDSDERAVYVAHLKAIEARKLEYKCPLTKQLYKTISQLLYDGKCCGVGCRHCPYSLSGCSDEVRRKTVWTGAYYADITHLLEQAKK